MVDFSGMVSPASSLEDSAGYQQIPHTLWVDPNLQLGFPGDRVTSRRGENLGNNWWPSSNFDAFLLLESQACSSTGRDGLWPMGQIQPLKMFWQIKCYWNTAVLLHVSVSCSRFRTVQGQSRVVATDCGGPQSLRHLPGPSQKKFANPWSVRLFHASPWLSFEKMLITPLWSQKGKSAEVTAGLPQNSFPSSISPALPSLFLGYLFLSTYFLSFTWVYQMTCPSGSHTY